MIKIDKALKEIMTKTHQQIQEEAAWSWCNRAAASYHLVSDGGLGHAEALRRFIEAEDYHHESLEHAALVEDDGLLYKQVKAAIKLFQDPALQAIGMTIARIT